MLGAKAAQHREVDRDDDQDHERGRSPSGGRQRRPEPFGDRAGKEVPERDHAERGQDVYSDSARPRKRGETSTWISVLVVA